MGAFATIVEVMASMDVFQLFFPWLLVLAITYGILEQSNVITEDQSVNGVIALSLAFFTIGGAYFFLPDMILIRFASALVFGVFAVLGLVVLLGISGVDLDDMGEDGGVVGNPVAGIAMLIFVVAFIGILIAETGFGDLFTGASGTNEAFEEFVMPVLVLLFMALTVRWTLGGGDD